MLQLDCTDRWQAYYRLCELGIPCRCQAYQALEVDVSTPQSIIQVQSVLKQSTYTRAELANWLETCWELTPQK